MFYVSFSNSLIIHRVEIKKVTTVREVWIPSCAVFEGKCKQVFGQHKYRYPLPVFIVIVLRVDVANLATSRSGQGLKPTQTSQ